MEVMIDVEEIKKNADVLEKLMASTESLRIAALDQRKICDKQHRALDLALDVMIAIANDDTAEARVRRRLAFALMQIKGIWNS